MVSADGLAGSSRIESSGEITRFPLALGMIGIAGLLASSMPPGCHRTPTTFHTADSFMFVFAVTTMAVTFWQLMVYCVLVSSHQVWTLS